MAPHGRRLLQATTREDERPTTSAEELYHRDRKRTNRPETSIGVLRLDNPVFAGGAGGVTFLVLIRDLDKPRATGHFYPEVITWG